jgi:hypothetical protein
MVLLHTSLKRRKAINIEKIAMAFFPNFEIKNSWMLLKPPFVLN